MFGILLSILILLSSKMGDRLLSHLAPQRDIQQHISTFTKSPINLPGFSCSCKRPWHVTTTRNHQYLPRLQVQDPWDQLFAIDLHRFGLLTHTSRRCCLIVHQPAFVASHVRQLLGAGKRIHRSRLLVRWLHHTLNISQLLHFGLEIVFAGMRLSRAVVALSTP